MHPARGVAKKANAMPAAGCAYAMMHYESFTLVPDHYLCL